jgi:predicted Fe-Mo cluster-binding NifX family protein
MQHPTSGLCRPREQGFDSQEILMSKIGFTTLLDRDDSVLSPHFGKAKWVMIRDRDAQQVTFEQNTALYGGAVVEILKTHGCTDAVFAEIGPGALRHLQQAGIRGWFAPANIPAPELLERLSRHELRAAVDVGERHAGKPAGGCCGQQHHGDEHHGCCDSR